MKKYIVILLSVLLLASCAKESGEKVAKAVLGDQSVMTFAAKSPAPQTVTVYSDGEWHTTAPDWISVSPSTGNGVMSVTVTVTENADAGGLLEPRKDKLIISGNTIASQLVITVSQEGDSYRNAEHIALSRVGGLDDGKAFVLDEATVAALSAAGIVLTDGTVNVYAKKLESVQVGDKVSVKGIKGTENGLAVINQVDEVKVNESGTFTPSEPTDITATMATYAADEMAYVKVSGVVAGGNLVVTVDETDYSFKQVDCPAELSIASLNGEKVDLTGYACGKLGANLFGILTTEMKDNGPAVVPRPEKLLYAKWRFTTTKLTDYAKYFGGTSGVVDLTEGFSDLYVPSNVEGNGKITYYQVDKTGTTPTSGNPKRIIGGTGHPYVTGAWPGDYWQFSATDNYEYPAGSNLHIKYLTRVSGTGQKYWMLEYFDGKEWKPAEEYPVETASYGGQSVQYNFIEPTSNVAVECNWKLAAPCREPMFRMRCVANWQANDKGPLDNPNGGTCRIADNDDDGEDAGPVFEVTDAPVTGGGGEVVNAPELPVEWSIQTDDNNFGTTWPLANGSATEEGVSGYINAVKGTGMIWYNNEAGNAADKASGLKKTKLDINAKDPRVTGAWPGDYCQFKVPGTVAAGKKVRITFETRTSATNPKYWKLVYQDGSDFKPACEVKTEKVEGTDVEYTHTMNSDGSTNIQVDATVTYAAQTEGIVFRFVCQSAMGAGGTMLTAPNGGTWRLAVTDVSKTDWQPRIQWAD